MQKSITKNIQPKYVNLLINKRCNYKSTDKKSLKQRNMYN